MLPAHLGQTQDTDRTAIGFLRTGTDDKDGQRGRAVVRYIGKRVTADFLLRHGDEAWTSGAYDCSKQEFAMAC